jgi:hypothetical protein
MLATLFRLPLTDSRTHALRCALLGFAVLAVRVAWWPGWPFAALLLGVFVIVPLGLALINPREPRGFDVLFWRAAVWLQLPAALSLLAATAQQTPGDVAALLAMPWLCLTMLVAIAGLARLLRRGVWSLSELCIDFAMIYLAIGGIWTVLACWGSAALQAAINSLGNSGEGSVDLLRLMNRALGFPDVVVQLTAVHFHFAGFVLPLLTGMVARSRPGLESSVAVAGVIAGIPLVAIGINLTQIGEPDFEPWAAWFLSAAGALTAVLHLWHAGRLPPLPRTLFTVSGVSLLAAMTLSSLYAWGRFSDRPVLDIERMLPSHGAINALGFALVGLIAWLLHSDTEV